MRSTGRIALLALFAVGVCAQAREATEPREYVALRSAGNLNVDGKLDEPSWQRVPWTEYFVHAEGGAERPAYNTRAKFLWDDLYLYIAADIEEPHVWASLTKRDTTVYHDNDFEVYIDPDGDTHEYYELSVNAHGAIRDVLLLKPYRDRGNFVQAWDLSGLQTGVQVWGTLNDPLDVDVGWSVELALPWVILAECANRPAPPRDRDTWRVNLSRLQWTVDSEEEMYVKAEDAEATSWVWSPQDAIDMHLPEKWGYVQFSRARAGQQETVFHPQREEEAVGILRSIYDKQRLFHDRHGRFSTDLDSLGLEYQILRDFLWPPMIQITSTQFEASLEELVDLHDDGSLNHWRIRQDSKIWKD